MQRQDVPGFPMTYVSDFDRCEIIKRFEERKGTVYGKPATILGRFEERPTVAALDGSGSLFAATWLELWQTVMQGRFNTTIKIG